MPQNWGICFFLPTTLLGNRQPSGPECPRRVLQVNPVHGWRCLQRRCRPSWRSLVVKQPVEPPLGVSAVESLTLNHPDVRLDLAHLFSLPTRGGKSTRLPTTQVGAKGGRKPDTGRLLHLSCFGWLVFLIEEATVMSDGCCKADSPQ